MASVKWFSLLILLVFGAALMPAAAQERDLAARLEELGGVPCPEIDFICVTLTVPLDHTNGASNETLDVVFAVQPAVGESLGMFVTATGGPGSSGIALAEEYSAYYHPDILENFDIVFFDQRGLGMSGGFTCPAAAVVYYDTDFDTTTPEGEAALLKNAQTFAQDCTAEMESPAFLPYLGTTQAVRDLELFREMIGDDQIWLYGESYGTQFAQTYATLFPDRLALLILDGVVDLSLTGEAYYVQQTQAFSDVVTGTLEACNADSHCAADLGGDAVAFYDDLFAELRSSPAVIDFPLPDGTTEERPFAAGMLEFVAANAAYGRDGRANFLRLLAYAAQGNLQYLLRQYYQDLSVDPVTLEAIPDPSWSDGGYYAVECSDYSFFSGTTEERAEAWLRAGDEIEQTVPRLTGTFYTDLPCLYWTPSRPPTERPAPFTGGSYVTFILNSTTDPATPFQQGFSMFDQVQNAVMITMQGGPHVLFGRETLCPDVMLANYMVYEVMPEAREFVCPGEVIDSYNPPARADAATTLDADDLIRVVHNELINLPEYLNWGAEDTLSVGCPYGGLWTAEPTDEGENFTFKRCGILSGFTMTGSGEYLYDDDFFTLTITATGAAEWDMVYQRDYAADTYTVSGTVDGKPIKLTP